MIITRIADKVTKGADQATETVLILSTSGNPSSDLNGEERQADRRPRATMTTAFITGITGQDGSYLTELLLSKGYEVHGLIRRSSSETHLSRLAHLPSDANLYLHHGDLGDSGVLARLVHEIEPDEVYNLAAQSDVKLSFDIPEFTADVTGTGTLRLLEAVRLHSPNARFYQASSSEMFGATPPPQSEQTRFHPRSPYAAAKVMAHNLTVNYREGYGLFAASGILFNHESPRRGELFVTRKITKAVARIKHGLQDDVALGNLDAKRDWGFAGDYVEAMWRMLQHDAPDDFVIATGEAKSVRDFCKAAFGHVDLDWEAHVRIDPQWFRPAEVDYLLGDPTKAKTELGWNPTVGFLELVAMMVDADLVLAEAEAAFAAVATNP